MEKGIAAGGQDVDYCVDYACDMIDGVGDFCG